MDPRTILEQFDDHLAERGIRLEAIVIGGAAMNLLGIVSRTTRHVDVLDPALPVEVVAAAADFARLLRARGEILRDDWLNDGPSALVRDLPDAWRERVVTAFRGQAIVLGALGRFDFLCTKLFALCDRGEDLDDCIALAPTADELKRAAPWVEARDANALWPAHVRATIDDLERRLRGGISS